MALEGLVCWQEPDNQTGPCQYITKAGGGIDFIAKATPVVTYPADAYLIILQDLGLVNGVQCYEYRVQWEALTSPTTTTTKPPITFVLTPACAGNGINGTGTILVNTFGGGNGTYDSVGIGGTYAEAYFATPTALSGATSYTYTAKTNGTYFVVLRDSSGGFKVNSTTVSCTNTTTTTSTTSTTSTTTSTSTTTTAAPLCNYSGETAIALYGTSTSTTSTTSTSTSTTSTSTSTSTTSTSTTTTAAPTSTSTSTSTSTTTAAYNFYTATRYNCSDCSADLGTFVISFPLSFYPNPNKWYRPTTPNGYTYKPIAITGTASAESMNTTPYVNCLSACQITTTSTSTSTTSTSTTSTSTTTAAPVFVKVYLEEYDLGVYAAPLLDLDLVVNTTPYYYDGNYTQYNPGNTSTNIILKTKDGIASHQWGAHTTASVSLRVYENSILVLNETNYYRKNEGAVDFTSVINYASGYNYTVSASNQPYATPTEQIYLLEQGEICGVQKTWTAGTVQEVKCDWLEVFDGTPSFGGANHLYNTSAGINVGTQIYNSTPGPFGYPYYPPLNATGNYVYHPTYPSGAPTTAKVITLVNGIITAINNISDLPACGTYVCP